MEGKTIIKTLALGDNYLLAKFDDGVIGFFQVITPDGLEEDLFELLEDKFEKSEPEEKTKAQQESKSEPESEDYIWKDMEEMNYKTLKKFCKENELDTKPKDFDEDEMDDFRREVATEIGVDDIPEKEKAKTEPENKDDDYTWKDLVEMDFNELEDLCDEKDLSTDPDDFDEDEEGDEDKLRRDIAEELGIEPPPKKKKKKE